MQWSSSVWPIHSIAGWWPESHIPGPQRLHKFESVHGIFCSCRNWYKRPRAFLKISWPSMYMAEMNEKLYYIPNWNDFITRNFLFYLKNWNVITFHQYTDLELQHHQHRPQLWPSIKTNENSRSNNWTNMLPTYVLLLLLWTLFWNTYIKWYYNEWNGFSMVIAYSQIWNVKISPKIFLFLFSLRQKSDAGEK